MQDKNRTQNPATGKFHTDLEMMAERAKRSAETMGMSDADKAGYEVQLRAEEDTPSVQQYVLPMVSLLRDFRGPAVELRRAIPEIDGLVSLSKQDGTLSKPERRRIEEYAGRLKTFIQHKTAILARVTSKMQSVVKDKREALSDHLSENPFVLAKAFGHLMKRREHPIERQLAEGKSNLLQNRVKATHAVLDEENAKFDAKQQFGGGETDGVGITPSKRKGKTSADGAPEGAVVGQTLKEILVVNKGVSDRVDTIIALMRASQDEDAQDRDAVDRNAQETPDDLRLPAHRCKVVKAKTAKQGRTC
jgi:hypothetical protein